jgi:hypothetical protein
MTSPSPLCTVVVWERQDRLTRRIPWLSVLYVICRLLAGPTGLDLIGAGLRPERG